MNSLSAPFHPLGASQTTQLPFQLHLICTAVNEIILFVFRKLFFCGSRISSPLEQFPGGCLWLHSGRRLELVELPGGKLVSIELTRIIIPQLQQRFTMIHQNNPLTHFFNLHSAASASGDTYRSEENDLSDEEEEEIDVDDSVHKSPQDEQTDLDMVSGSVGKSFTIAAILGLKAAAAVASTMNANDGGGGNVPSSGFKQNYSSSFNHSHQRPFNDVMNLSSLLPSSAKPPTSSYEAHLQQMNRLVNLRKCLCGKLNWILQYNS